MTRSLRSILVLVLAASGCVAGPLSPAERSDLRASRALWARKGGPDYTVEARIGCFCVPHINFWTRLTVRGGRVTATLPLQPLPGGIVADTLGWQTVEQVFEHIGRREDVLADVAVRFDRTLGYPQSVTFSCRPNIADCGAVYEMRNLTIP